MSRTANITNGSLGNAKCSSGPDIYVDEGVSEVARKVLKQKRKADEAFFICDVRNLEKQFHLWRRHLPGVHPFFAVKCCTDSVVLQTLASLGVNFDCSCLREMEAVLDMGVAPDRIVYANTVKCTSHLDFAEKHDVTLMTFDSVEELIKIKDKRARLLLKIAASCEGSAVSMNRKFGCDLFEAEKLLKLASALRLKIVGVSFHVGLGSRSPEDFARSVAAAKFVFEAGARVGFRMRVLDIGGSFVGGSRMESLFVKYCEIVRLAIERHFPPPCDIQVIAEPGQFFVTSAYSLVSKVVAKKTETVVTSEGSLPHDILFINESKWNCISKDLFDLMDVNITPLEPPYERQRDRLTTMWGASCHPIDCMFELSPFFEVSVDEWLLMDNMGAYTLVMASGFNGFGFPAVKYVTSKVDEPRVQRILDSMVVRSGYSHMECVVKSCHGNSNNTDATLYV